MITLLENHILLISPIWNVWVFPSFSYRKTRECPLFLESTFVACLGITSLSRKWWKERTTCKGGTERRSKYSNPSTKQGGLSKLLSELWHWGWCPVLWIHGTLPSIYLSILLQGGFFQTSPMLGSHQMLFLVRADATPDPWEGGQSETTRSETNLTERSCSKWHTHSPIHSTILWPGFILGCQKWSINRRCGTEPKINNKYWAPQGVGELTVGCPWNAKGLLWSKPNSLLLEWISTSRCPRLTRMPR